MLGLGKRVFAVATALVVASVTIGLFGIEGPASASERLVVDEFTLSDSSLGLLRESFYDQVEASHAPGDWAPLRMELSDADLAVMGLPSRAVLQSADLSRPVVVPAAKGG